MSPRELIPAQPPEPLLRPTASDPDRVLEVPVRRLVGRQLVASVDEVVAEEPLEIQIAGRPIALIMRTPGHDGYLAAGFLLAEGIVATPDDVQSIEPGVDREGFPQANVVSLRLRPELEASDRLGDRHFAVSSSCGLCGKASIAAAQIHAPPVRSAARVDVMVLLSLDATLRASQAVFRRTGGAHAAGLFECTGRLVVAHEDVGRHNAVDKVIGQMFLERRLPLDQTILLVSGRASFELLLKAAVAEIPIFVAVGAPSSLAVEMAQASQITLVGLLRPGRFVVYTYPERVVETASSIAGVDRPDVE